MSTISPRHFDDEVDDVTAAGPVPVSGDQRFGLFILIYMAHAVVFWISYEISNHRFV